ncbi:MAG: hypothetical protein FJX89_05980 [Bacteroidetes bacterium]|nr:hypothetical protein [Bacteroidota bacterium]
MHHPQPRASEEELLEALAREVDRLIVEDFQRLIAMLYRLDIPEQRLKEMLRKHRQAEAGRIIAHLILERQKEKQRSREATRTQRTDIPEEERW